MPLHLHVDARSGFPVYLQIVDQIRRAVAVGVLQPGEQLPSVKFIASTLVVNPATVSRALRELEHLDIIESHAGRGSFIRGNGVASAAKANADDIVRRSIEAAVREARSLGIDENDVTRLMLDALAKTYRGS
ncbi:MAG: GntR family transcriptional regulator [Candidatus Baltobacteraceae bacterium]